MLTGDVMEPLSELTHTGWPFPFTPQDWEHTPSAVQAYLRAMRDELGQLQERVAPWKLASRRTQRPPIGGRRRTRPTRSRASVQPPPRPGKLVENRAIRAIARRCSPPR